MLNFSLGEPFSLDQEMPFLDNPIKLDPLLESSLDMCVHYLISVDACSMQSWLIYVGFNYSVISEVSNNGGKYRWRRSILKTECKPRKAGVLISKSLSPTTLVIV
jgi:hypothetical protein